MMKINYLEGDATKPERTPTMILHCVNSGGTWGAGFVIALSKRWKEPEKAYKKWYEDTCHYIDDNGVVDKQNGLRETPFMLGDIQVVPVENGLYVCNMIAQKDTGYFKDMPPVRYECLRECLLRVVDVAKALEIKVLSGPRFCSALAGGEWPRIEAIINEVVCTQGIEVDIYDLPTKGYFPGRVEFNKRDKMAPTEVEYSDLPEFLRKEIEQDK
jgi:hypothetical protein